MSIIITLSFSLKFGVGFFLILNFYKLIKHYYFLVKLDKWLSYPSLATLPIGTGSWEIIFSKLYRSHKKQKNMKKDLTNALDQFMSGAQALPDGVISLNEYNEIIWANKKVQVMLGIKIPQDLNKPITYIVRNTKLIDLIDSESETPKDIVIIMGNNHYQLYLVEFGYHQKIIICRDIGNEMRIEESRKQFISDVSHELKTPLTVLMGNAEILFDKIDKKSEYHKPLKSMIEQTNRMNTLISDLLILNSIDGQKNNTRNNKIAIKEIINNLTNELDILRGDKLIDFSYDELSEKKIIGSKKEIVSALQNLVSNAFRYTNKGYVKVTWSEERKLGILSVKDSGIGIPESHISKLTERFHRVDSDRSRNTGGTGLGLSIVKNIMDQHSGSVEIISDGKSGSEFKLIFPEERIVKN
jgi:two-component system phosphate regulon sensor histidine kinase PhoR